MIIWKPIPGYEDRYEVSNFGEVRSLINNYGNRRGAPRPLKPNQSGRYDVVRLHRSGDRGRCFLTHRLVLIAFDGPCPDGMECRHLNGDPRDNRLANLRWGTRQENAADKALHGRTIIGTKHHNARLTPGDVVEIRALLAAGMPQRDIAEMFSVSQPSITNIHLGRTWAHVHQEL